MQKECTPEMVSYLVPAAGWREGVHSGDGFVLGTCCWQAGRSALRRWFRTWYLLLAGGKECTPEMVSYLVPAAGWREGVHSGDGFVLGTCCWLAGRSALRRWFRTWYLLLAGGKECTPEMVSYLVPAAGWREGVHSGDGFVLGTCCWLAGRSALRRWFRTWYLLLAGCGSRSVGGESTYCPIPTIT